MTHDTSGAGSPDSTGREIGGGLHLHTRCDRGWLRLTVSLTDLRKAQIQKRIKQLLGDE